MRRGIMENSPGKRKKGWSPCPIEHVKSSDPHLSMVWWNTLLRVSGGVESTGDVEARCNLCNPSFGSGVTGFHGGGSLRDCRIRQ